MFTLNLAAPARSAMIHKEWVARIESRLRNVVLVNEFPKSGGYLAQIYAGICVRDPCMDQRSAEKRPLRSTGALAGEAWTMQECRATA